MILIPRFFSLILGLTLAPSALSLGSDKVVTLSHLGHPVITLEASGTGAALPNRGTLRFATGSSTDATDPPLKFSAPEGPLDLVFPHIVPGTYQLQVSPRRHFFSAALPTVTHPMPGPLSFIHDPGPVVNVFYRLARLLDPCQTVTIRNTGDAELTGIQVAVSGVGAAFFSVDTSSTATSLSPGQTTTVDVCFVAQEVDVDAHLAILTVSGEATASVRLQLLGDNEPEPIIFTPPPDFVSSSIIPGTASSPVRFSGTICGQAGTTILLEGSSNIDITAPWDEIARVTIDSLGCATIPEVAAPDTIGLPRYFFQLRVLALPEP